MTLTPAQWSRIYEAIPCSFEDCRLRKLRAQQYVSPPAYPLIIVSIASHGIPVTDWGLMRRSPAVVRETWGRICKARISLVVEALDITECERLASLVYHALYSDELAGLNPYHDGMQFRGADPPESLPPYYLDKKHKLVHRFGIDFFVEYELTWQKDYDTIQTIVAKVNRAPQSAVRDWGSVKQPRSSGYMVDVILEE